MRRGSSKIQMVLPHQLFELANRARVIIYAQVEGPEGRGGLYRSNDNGANMPITCGFTFSFSGPTWKFA